MKIPKRIGKVAVEQRGLLLWGVGRDDSLKKCFMKIGTK